MIITLCSVLLIMWRMRDEPIKPAPPVMSIFFHYFFKNSPLLIRNIEGRVQICKPIRLITCQ